MTYDDRRTSTSSDKLRAVDPSQMEMSRPAEPRNMEESVSHISGQLGRFFTAWEAVHAVLQQLISEIEESRKEERDSRRSESRRTTILAALLLLLTAAHIGTAAYMIRQLHSSVLRVDKQLHQVEKAQATQLRTQLLTLQVVEPATSRSDGVVEAALLEETRPEEVEEAAQQFVRETSAIRAAKAARSPELQPEPE